MLWRYIMAIEPIGVIDNKVGKALEMELEHFGLTTTTPDEISGTCSAILGAKITEGVSNGCSGWPRTLWGKSV
jgi:hypothetical protein